MKKEFMHKDLIIAEITETKDGQVSAVSVLHPEFFPNLGDDSDLNNYRKFKLIRQTNLCRKDIQPYVGFYGFEHFISNTLRSLNDCYWVRDKGSNLSFQDISAFRIDDLSEDDIFLSMVRPSDFESFGFDSPNLCIQSQKPIFWYQDEDQLGYINKNAQADMFLYKTAKEHQINIVKPRKYLIIYNTIYTFVPIATNEHLERISFEQLYYSTKDENLSNGANIQKCCETYQIKNWKPFISSMIQLNKLIQIPLSELYVFRNADTGEYLEFDKI